jgi:hypothetical protein
LQILGNARTLGSSFICKIWKSKENAFLKIFRIKQPPVPALDLTPHPARPDSLPPPRQCTAACQIRVCIKVR